MLCLTLLRKAEVAWEAENDGPPCMRQGTASQGRDVGHSPCKVHGEYVTLLQDRHPYAMEGRDCQCISAT